jgi:glutathione S-transferase
VRPPAIHLYGVPLSHPSMAARGMLERIARALETVAPRPSLYPDGAEPRSAAERAERWGEAELQPVPRRLVRWGLRHRLRQRQWFADVATPLPAPAVMGAVLSPLAPVFVLQVGASNARVRRDLAELPGLLETIDRLLADSVIGGEPGAADFQIAASVRVLTAMEDVAPLVRARPAELLAYRLVPDVPPIPAALPPEWVPGVATGSPARGPGTRAATRS